MLMLLINNCNAKAKEAKNEIPYGLSKDGKTFFGKQVDATTLFFLAIAFPKYIPIGQQPSSPIIFSELENPYWLALVELLNKEDLNKRSVTESAAQTIGKYHMIEEKFLQLFGRSAQNEHRIAGDTQFQSYKHFKYLLSNNIKVYNEHIIDKNMYSNAITKTYYKYFTMKQNNTFSYLCFKENAHGQKDYLIAKFKDEQDKTYEEIQLPNSGKIQDWADFKWETIFSTDNVNNLKAEEIHFNAAIKMFKHKNASPHINDEDKAKEIQANYDTISNILKSLEARIAGQPQIADFFTQLKATINALEQNLQDNNIKEFISHLEKAKIINNWFVNLSNPEVNFEKNNKKYMELNETILNMLYDNIEKNKELYPELKVENNKFSIGHLASYNNDNGSFIPYYNKANNFQKLFKQNYDQNNNPYSLTEIKYTKPSEQKADSAPLNNNVEEKKNALFAQISKWEYYENAKDMKQSLYKKNNEKPESIDQIDTIIEAMLKPAIKSKMASELSIAQEMIELMPIEKFSLDTLLQFHTKYSSLPYFISQTSAAVGAKPTLCIALIEVFFLDMNYKLDSSLLLVLQNAQIAGKTVNDQFIENSIEDQKKNQEHYDNLKDSELQEDLSAYKKLKRSYEGGQKHIGYLKQTGQYSYISQEASKDNNLLLQRDAAQTKLLQKLRDKKLNQFTREFNILTKSFKSSLSVLNNDNHTFDGMDEHKINWLNEEIPKLEKLVTPSTT
jgi:hypothetical protein